MTDTRTQALVTQADRDAAADWTFIECMRCSEYEGDFGADLAADFAAHRIAALDGLNPDAIADVVSIVKRFVALPSGAWHPDRHAAEEMELMQDAAAVLKNLEAQS